MPQHLLTPSVVLIRLCDPSRADRCVVSGSGVTGEVELPSVIGSRVAPVAYPQNVTFDLARVWATCAKRGASKARTFCRSKCRCGTVTRVVLNQRMHTSAFHGDAEAQLLVDKGFALFGYGSLVWKQGTLKVSSPRGGFINVSDCAPRLLVGDAGVHMI